MKNPIFEMSADTRLLRQRLATVGIGETITYEELGAEVSKAVNAGFPSLNSARQSLLRNEQMVFAPIRGVGLKRLGDADIVKASDRSVQRVRNAARQGVRQLAAVQDFASLPPKDQLAYTTKMSVMVAVSSMVSNRALTKAEDKVALSGRTKELPISETLEMFK